MTSLANCARYGGLILHCYRGNLVDAIQICRQRGLMTSMIQEASYTAVFEAAEEGGFVVTFPAIPGLATQGETLEEAKRMASDCLRAYLESLALDGEAPPYEAPERPLMERVTVPIAA
jgi:predicted RNase H-like HicB family nuclease